MCPRCGSEAVESRERCDNGLQRFNCVPCTARLGQQFAMFTDWTSSIFEESKLRPREWLLVMGLWQLKLNATDIAAAADIQERTAQRCINLLDGGIFETGFQALFASCHAGHDGDNAWNPNFGHRRPRALPIRHTMAQEVLPIHHNLLGAEDGLDNIHLMRVLHNASLCLGGVRGQEHSAFGADGATWA